MFKLDNLLLVLYDKAFGTKLFEKDVEGMVSLFLARVGFERRIFLASLEPEQSAVAHPFLEPQDRLAALLDILNGGIKAIRSGEHQILTRLSPLISLTSEQGWRFTLSPRTLPLHACELSFLSGIVSL
jgi:hypothetical protein